MKSYKRRYASAFVDLGECLKRRLIDNMMKVPVAQEERAIAEDIFARLDGIPLVDPYDAYEKLDGSWMVTANDLEMLQEEGFDAVRKVDPNLVIKKKDGKEQEVQDGWVGHIIPFKLVQETLLRSKADKIADKETELEDQVGKLASLMEELGEEDKEKYLNDDNDAFDAKAVSARIEELFAERFPKAKVKKADRLAYLAQKGGFASEACEGILIAAALGLANEKALKSEIKTMRAALEEATKVAIENLSDSDAKMLLERKWITPLVVELKGLPDAVIGALVSKVQTLAAKYAETFNDVEGKMRAAESELAGLLDDLTGDAYDLKGLKAVKGALK